MTRWNSAFLMIRSVLNAYDAVRVILNDSSNKEHRYLLLKDDEIELLEELLTVLEPFYDFTERLSGSKYVTCSIIISTYFLLVQCLDSFKSNSCHSEIEIIVEKLKTSLIERCGCYLNKIEILTATFLDPRFRNFRFINDVHERSKYLKNVTLYLIDQGKLIDKSRIINTNKVSSVENNGSQVSVRKNSLI